MVHSDKKIAGRTTFTINKLLGHEKIDTTMIYAHASLESVRSGHQKHIA